MRQTTLHIVLAAATLSMLSGCSSVPNWVPTWAGGPAHPVASGPTIVEPMSMKVTDPQRSADLGELHYQVESEHLAKDSGCAAEPHASLLDKGPGFETYTLACANSQLMVVRCDFSYCRQSK